MSCQNLTRQSDGNITKHPIHNCVCLFFYLCHFWGLTLFLNVRSLRNNRFKWKLHKLHKNISLAYLDLIVGQHFLSSITAFSIQVWDIFFFSFLHRVQWPQEGLLKWSAEKLQNHRNYYLLTFSLELFNSAK